jgi:tetratricopeptide (TPR) repeat protein
MSSPCLNDKGAVDEAIAAYKKVIHLKPDYALAYSNLGEALKKKGAVEEAIAACKEAIRLQPDLADAHFSLGNIFQGAGRRNEAEQAFRQALRLYLQLVGKSPDNAQYHSDLAGTMNLLARVIDDRAEARHLYEEALAHQHIALKSHPHNPRYRQNLRAHLSCLSQALVAMGAHTEAVRIAAEMPREFPEEVEAYFIAADVLVGCVQQAERDPALTAAARQTAIDAHRQQHRQLTDEVLKRGADEPAVPNNVAWDMATCADPRFRNPQRAVLLAKKAVALAPPNGGCWNTLGTAYYRAGQWKDAVAALEKSMQLRSGGDSFDWFFLAMSHRQLGDPAKAREWYDRAVQWMDKNKPQDEELRSFRAEAAALLGIREQPVNKQ